MSTQQAPLSTPTSTLNLDNIQGDILLGLPKKVERYIFLAIKDVKSFRTELTQLVPLITTTNQVLHDRSKIKEHKATSNDATKNIPLSGTNIAFSQTGLTKLGHTEDLADTSFKNGQLKDAAILGDPFDGTPANPKWIPQFKKEIDVVIFISGDCEERLDERAVKIRKIFAIGTPQQSVDEIFKLQGNVRPGKEKGHEHFGFLDGISQPAVDGFDTPLPGQESVPPGIILFGNTGDPHLASHPDWTKDGSFLVFRKLQQLVPEFDHFLEQNPIALPGLTPEQGSVLLGARMVGRWKSGAPIDITPLVDDPKLGADPQRNNNFNFSTDSTQTRCPFSAHVRKTNPRSDLAQFGGATTRRIIRQGIPYGPEVSQGERQSKKSEHDRGLAFVCYQSSIDNGFHFIQHSWANAVNFPPKPNNFQSGFDPIIGMNGNGARQFAGTNPNAQDQNLTATFDFVVPDGGEYFFSPSISTLKNVFATKA